MATVSVVFNRSGRLRSDGLGRVHVRLVHDSKPYYFDTKILILPAQWDKRRSCVVRHQLAGEWNEDLRYWVDAIHKYHRAAYRSAARFDPVKCLDSLRYDASVEVKLLDYALKINEQEKGRLAKSTLDKRGDLFGKLEKYNSGLLLSELDREEMQRFRGWLFGQKSHKGTLLGPNYVYSLFVLLRKFVKLARIDGHVKGDPFDGFSISREAKTPEVLTESELETFWNYAPSRSALYRAKVRMLFLFYTGMRVGDSSAIREEHFKENGLLVYLAGKTAKRKGKYARVLLSMFDNRARFLFDNYGPFRSAHNYHLNSEFREILKELGINKYMTVHGARHTFKSIALERGMPLHIIAEMMAHSDMRTTAKYGRISDSAILGFGV